MTVGQIAEILNANIVIRTKDEPWEELYHGGVSHIPSGLMDKEVTYITTYVDELIVEIKED